MACKRRRSADSASRSNSAHPTLTCTDTVSFGFRLSTGFSEPLLRLSSTWQAEVTSFLRLSGSLKPSRLLHHSASTPQPSFLHESTHRYSLQYQLSAR
ncbi:hypothetical protein HanHA89_Chr07g0274231 [Helianthus annuus]|nr:hypothetical protein HanHA89_Chr07g0274231 [Helianthus annuus]